MAIKFLSPELVADERANKRLVKEARAAATLDHPNICSIYEVGEADGRSFIAMQYIGMAFAVTRAFPSCCVAPDCRSDSECGDLSRPFGEHKEFSPTD